MMIWKQISEIFKKPVTSERHKEGKERFLKKYQSFQTLLSENNVVLELMADIEEKLSSNFPVDRQEILGQINEIAKSVRKIIDHLNQISKDKYAVLNERLNEIHSKIENFLTKKHEIPISSYTKPFDEINKGMIDMFGNKNANLGEIRNSLKIPTPEGFAISTFAFKKFMEHNRLLEKIEKTLSELCAEDMEVLNNKSRKIQDEIAGAQIPEDLEEEILNAYRRLCNKCGYEVKVSVRSSAVHEDGEFSFAGQYSTFLNVPSDQILLKYKEVVASLYNPIGIFYYKTKGLYEHEMAMAVCIVQMIDARCAGVMYTRDPNNPETDTMIISSVRGLGKPVVEGAVAPETYIMSRSIFQIIQKNIPAQKTMLVSKPDADVEVISLSDNTIGIPCLIDEHIKTLAEYAIAIEKHYACPQDIEWAVGKDNMPYILQTRPLNISIKEEISRYIPEVIKGYNILIDKGIIACKGIDFGRAYIVRQEEDLENFPEGAVLIAKHTSAKFVTVMKKASAIVTDIGAATVHMATVAREFQIPTIVDTEVATEVIQNGLEITVDAINCLVYEGRVKELSEFSRKKERYFKRIKPLKDIDPIIQWVIPLNLVNPDDERFRPELCETFHDIARFAHQKAMHEMFKISKELPEDVEAVRLVAGIPLDIYIIDLGEGIEGMSEEFRPDHIRSIPLKAFLRGLTSLTWPEPRHVDVKGFLGMMARTASIPESELEQMGEKSFTFISREYMNFSIRLGYHLSVVEAYTGENINDNYIRFLFKGGGADMKRRLRRVRLVSEVLKNFDFHVKTTEDSLEAIITKYKRAHLEDRLEILGRLTVYTKQMDAVMYDDATTELYLEQFINEHVKL
jgi:pyruvate, water dikinase